MFKRMFSLFMSIVLVMSMSTGFAKAYNQEDLMTGSFEFDGEIYTYKYREADGQVVYAEIGEDVIEREGNVIYVNGLKVASYTDTPIVTSSSKGLLSIENSVTPRSGWMWTESGNRSDYQTVAYDTNLRNISLEKTIGTIAVGTLAAIIIVFLPISGAATAVASSIINGVTAGFAAYYSSKTIYCYETIYKKKYLGINYAKMVNQKFYYDSDLTDEVPNSEKTIYGSWG